MTSQLGAKLVHLALNAVSTLAILRYLAPDAYGTYVLVLTVTTLAGVIADFGLPKLALREMVRPGEDASDVAGTVIAIRLVLAVTAVVACQVVIALFHEPPEVHLAALVASMVVMVEAILGVVVVVFQARLVQQYEAMVRVVAEGVETSLVLVLIVMGASLPWLFVPPVVGLVVGLVAASVLARRIYALRPRVSRSLVKPYLIEALPLGPALLIGVLYLKLDSFVVAALRPSADLGLYGAAYQPVEYLFLGSAVIINVIFPLVAGAWAEQRQDRFQALYRRGTELLVIVMLFIPVVVLVTASGVVRLVFGEAYAASVAPLQVLSVALVLMTVNAWQSIVLLSGGHQRITLGYNIVALVLTLGLSITLVRAIGMVGAAVATVATGVFVLGCSTLAVRRRMHATLDARRLGLVVVSAAVTLAALLGLDTLDAPWPIAMVAAAIVYVAALGRFGFHRSLREVLA